MYCFAIYKNQKTLITNLQKCNKIKTNVKTKNTKFY